jgi:hypothetical protein
MANEPEPDVEEISRENRNMWIAVAVIVLIIAGGMGVNMLIHHDTNPDAAEMSVPSK